MTLRRWLLVVGLALMTLAGCGGSDANNGAAASTDAVESVELVEVEPTAAPESVAAPEPTTEPAPSAVPEPTAARQATAEPEPAAEPEAPAITPVVFADDFGTSIQPIFAENCASCHNAAGPGASHWRLDNAADLVATHTWILQTVQTRYMPPWPSSDLSVSFHNERNLRADEIDAIAAWSQAGAPLDVAESTPVLAPNGVVALDADIEVAAREPYAGSPEVKDDYRCMIYELGVTESRYMVGFEFVPDQDAVVHHAIGYLAPESALGRAEALSAEDDAAGWQCYGGSGLNAGDNLFLGWAPGQLPTQYPEGSGVLVEPGSFVVVQVHYHFHVDAPADASTLRIDWSDDENLDPIAFSEFIGPAEIPCSVDESGPLCDRDEALKRAIDTYGREGVLADGINGLCGVTPEDFASMTNGIASSSCTIPVRSFGEIVSVFGHEHEIGKSFRMTLNAGTADELILLDIPDWSFDWQYNYYPSESIMLEPGDSVLIECSWDRSRRDPNLEPAYVLWADGTNDEMCFAMISLRQDSSTAAPVVGALEPLVPPKIAACLENAGVSFDIAPQRDEIDGVIDELFDCAEPEEIGEAFATLISENFSGLVSEEGTACLAELLSSRDGARNLLIFGLPDSTEAERLPTGEIVADCVTLSDAMTAFGLPIDESAARCVDEVGRPLLIEATIQGEIPEAQVIFAQIAPCLGGD